MRRFDKTTDRGFAIAVVLIFAMFMMVFAVTLMRTQSDVNQAGQKQSKKIRAMWMANSGVQLTLMKIKELREEFYDALKWSGNGTPAIEEGSGNAKDVHDCTRFYPRKHPFHNLFFSDATGGPSVYETTAVPSNVMSTDVVADPPADPDFISCGKGGSVSEHYAYLDMFKSDIRTTRLDTPPSGVISAITADLISNDGCITNPTGQCTNDGSATGQDPYTGHFFIVMDRTATSSPSDGKWANEGLIRLSSALYKSGGTEEYTEQDSIQIKINAIAHWMADVPGGGGNYKTMSEDYPLSKIEKLERHR